MSTDDRNEIIESEYLIQCPWLTARRDPVKLPTGVEILSLYFGTSGLGKCNCYHQREGKFVLVTPIPSRNKRNTLQNLRRVCETGEELCFLPNANCTKKQGMAMEMDKTYDYFS